MSGTVPGASTEGAGSAGNGPRLRVAIIALYPLDAAHMAGGMRVAVYNLVQALGVYSDLDIHVIYCDDEVDHDHSEMSGHETVHYLSLPRRRVIPNYISSVQRITRALPEIAPDIVNAHASHFAIPALRAGLPTVLTLHGVGHREAAIYNHGLYDRARYGLMTLYDRYTLPRVHDIIAISPYVVREYAGRTQARWHRIDNPLPDAYFNLVRAEQPGRILYAGTITPLKEILTLLKALVTLRATIPAVHLRIAGRTVDAAYENELRQFVAANGLSDHVNFLGLLDMPGMLQEYAACSLVALPSRQEVLPMTIIESMAGGIAVAATRAGGLADLVADGEAGLLVDVGDSAALAASIVRLLHDPGLRQRLGENGRSIADNRFRASSVAAKYRDVYYEVAGKRAEVTV